MANDRMRAETERCDVSSSVRVGNRLAACGEKTDRPASQAVKPHAGEPTVCGEAPARQHDARSATRRGDDARRAFGYSRRGIPDHGGRHG